MPTVCKITLDAGEYRRELADVIEQSRVAAEKLSNVGGTAAPALKVEVDTTEAVEAANELKQDLAAVGDSPVTISVDPTAITAADDLTGALQGDLSAVNGSSPTIAVDASDVSDADDDALKLTVNLEKLNNANVTITVDSSELEQAKDAAESCGDGIRGALKKAWGEVTNLQGGFKKLWASIGAGGGAIGIIIAGIAAVGKIIAHFKDQAMQELQDLADMYRANTESIRDAAAANEELRQKSDGYMSQLGELASTERLSNIQKAEALRLIRELQKSYGDLSISINAATGRITGYDEAMVEKLKRDRAARIAEIDSAIASLRNEYHTQEKVIEESQTLLGRMAGGNKVAMDAANKQSDITKEIQKLAREKAVLIRDKDPAGDFLARRVAERKDLRRNAELQRRERYGRESDEVYSRLMHEGAFSAAAEVKRGQLEAARKRTTAAQKRVAAGETAVNNAANDVAKNEAQINLINLQNAYNAAKEKELAISKQLAAAEQKAADLKGQGLEYAQKAAIAAAEARRGRALTDDEKSSVERLASLEYGLTHDYSRSPGAAELSIQSDALTKRGGFKSGAVVPDADRWNRANNELQKKSVSRLDEIAGIVRELSPKKNNDDPGN